jgi:hypothetical protein
MVMVSNLPNSSLPLDQSEDKFIVAQNNRLTKVSLSTLSTEIASVTDHNALFNYNPLEHIDWTNATENLLTSGTLASSNLSGTNTGDQNLFDRFKVLGLLPATDIVATSTSDTFTFVPGPNISITTDPNTKELFISSTGGGGTAPQDIGIFADSFVPDGLTDTFVLGSTPADENHVLVFFDGVFQGTDVYDVLGNQITFGTTPGTFISKIDTFVYNDADLLVNRVIQTDGGGYVAGASNSIDLGSAPADGNHILVFFNGVVQGSDTYNVAGSIVNFTTTIPFGVTKIEVVEFVDPGIGGTDIDLNRELYLNGVNFTGGLTNILVLPEAVNSSEDILVFFDGLYLSDDNFTVNNAVITFATNLPTFVNKVEIIVLTGGIFGAAQPNSFGVIQVSGQADVLATAPTDTVEFIAGTNMSITTDNALRTVTFNSTSIPGDPDQNLFDRVQVGGVDQFTAATTTDPLNFEEGANITLTNPSPNTIRIETSGGLGEANTASNDGLGQSLVLPKSGVDLPFKGINTTDPNISLSSDLTDVLIGLNIPVLETNLNHDNLAGFLANEHIDWTNATQNLSTTGTIDSSNYDVTGSVAAGSANSGTNTGDQNTWYTITATSGANATPDLIEDSLNFVAGTNMSITSDGFGTLTFDSSGTGEANTADSPTLGETLILPKIGTILEFKGINEGDNNVVISSDPFDVLVSLNIPVLETNLNHDNLTGFVANEHIDWTNATDNILTTGTITGANLSGTNTGDQNLFQTISVATQNDVVADTTSDTLTLVAGTDIEILTDDLTDTITFNFDNPDAILESYTSAPQPIASGTQITLPHGLTGTPRLVHIDLLCTVSEAGYNAGDVANPFFVQASGNNRGAAVIETATDLIITYGSNAGVFMIINPSTGSSTQITNTSWQMIVSAFR